MNKMELRRSEEAAPSEPGRYYGKRKDNPEGEIIPLYVAHASSGLAIFACRTQIPLDEYRWFGPVPACIEAGT